MPFQILRHTKCHIFNVVLMQEQTNKYLEQKSSKTDRWIYGKLTGNKGSPINQWKRTGCLLDVLGKLAQYMEKIQLDPCLTPQTAVGRMDQRPN